MKLFRRIWRPDHSESAAHSLYGALVAQARRPSFYLEYGVADTLDGRVDMIFLHTIVLLRRLGQARHQTRRTAQSLYDILFYDLETGLREQGIGDDGVLHKLRAMTESFSGRVGAYDGALKEDDVSALVSALARNIYRSDRLDDARILRMAHYTRACVQLLDSQPIATLCEGRVRFAEPPTIPTPGSVKPQPTPERTAQGEEIQ
ncbi:ubiquinol-cytochrome C chaperone family protein [Varunaivibrio sulfuroxidans]|uniref:Cytochrome b pre-mRNA-processing protein 3 n=1 Tax=Varunaivibrio sulfuroxidans TaxID=1773489 RepID=A0A4V2UNB2_9PROT|nr:ubiquinol-cytochrome C chaperone family protein [Varunaivibrio sulfuroxidans]TCS61241.1 cytochrome b pre-mRNA-processing protein 3 [Varunaivibrio sulfuroxidans]WES31137.1 ubiquinol-cytochrome C chaperone family protein [Varunaivibrio sulfuroxidans]